MNPRLILILLLIGLLSTTHASAISIYLFAKMKNDDQATYITTMVEGAAKLLKDKGQPDQAQKTLDLFGDASKSGGINQFVQFFEAELRQHLGGFGGVRADVAAGEMIGVRERVGASIF